MVRAWYIDNDSMENPRDENHRLPPKFIALEDLYKVTGVEHHEVNVESYDKDGSFAKLKEEKGYVYEDTMETPGEEDLKEYFIEHFHENEQGRLCLEGCAYFDIRDKNDEWIRVEVVGGDLIVVPGGCYHRFMLDHKNHFKAKMLLKKSPPYLAHKRPADDLKIRQDYVNKLTDGAFEAEP